MPWAVAAAAVGVAGTAYNNNQQNKAAAKTAKLNSPTNQANAQAAVDHTNQYTPYGTSTWNVTGKNPDGTNVYSNQQTLSAPMQQQFNNQNQQNATLGQAGNRLAAQVNGQYSQPMDYSSAGGLNYGMTPFQEQQYSQNMQRSAGPASTYNASQMTGNTAYGNNYTAKNATANTSAPASAYNAGQMSANTANGADATTAERAAYGHIQDANEINQGQLDGTLSAQRDSMYRQQAAFLDPQWQQQKQELTTQLSGAGVVQNSEAYNKAMENFNRQREFAYGNAREQAIQSGGQEQTRLNNLGLDNGRFRNQAQAQGFDQSAQNSEFGNNIALANMAAKNQTNQFNAGQLNDVGQFNANASNDAARYNADSTTQNNQFNTGQLNNMEQFNADATNNERRFNTGEANNINQFNAGQLNQVSQYNADANNQASRYNADARNQNSQFNANLNNQALNQIATTGVANAQQNNQAQSQALSQLFAMRNQPMNELNSLRSATSLQNPNFTNTDGANINMMGAMQNNYQNQVANANNKAMGNASMINGVASLPWDKMFSYGGNSGGATPAGGSANDYSGSAYNNWLATQ